VNCTATRHDTTTAYRDHGCRCPAAREALRLEKAAYRKRLYLCGPSLIDKTGTIRRVHALARMGWPQRDIAALAGFSRPADLTNTGRLIHRDTAAAVDAVFRRLCMTPGPSRRVRAIAANRGYPGPLDWDDIDDPDETPQTPTAPRFERRLDHDWVQVERAVDGLRPALSHAELDEAVRRLHARQWGDQPIASWLGVSQRTVQRHRAALALPAAVGDDGQPILRRKAEAA
jgi:hypothetical protein